MIPPKYKFYIGKSVNFDIVDNTSISPITGQFISAINAVSSNHIAVNTNTVYINYSPSRDIFDDTNNIYAEGLNIHMYDSSSAYLGNIAIDKAKFCFLKKGTKSIALEFIGMLDDILEVHKSFVKSGFSEIYEIKQANPHYKELSKKYSKESNQEFFRVSLDGKINVFGKDYEFVHNSELNDTLIFITEKLNLTTTEWCEYYKGKFNKADCKFYYDKRKCELKLTTDDAYTKIMNNYDKSYDLIKLAPKISKIDLHKRSLIQVYVRGANSITNFFGGIYWEDDINEAVNDYKELKNKYYFSYATSGNEFYITGSRISNINSVYAGINGYWHSNDNKYTVYADDIMNTIGPDGVKYRRFTIKLKRNSDNKVLYEGEQITMEHRSEYDISIVDTAKLVNPEDSTDTCKISTVFVYDIFQRLLCDVDSISYSGSTKNTYDLPTDDFVADNRNYKKCIGIKNGLFFCTSRTVEKPTKFGINDYNKYFTDKFIPSYTGLGRALPVSRNSWANASLWYVYDDLYEFLEKNSRKKYTLKDSYNIADVIKALLIKVNPIIRHEATPEYSKFLYGNTNPITLARFYVYITQKTNVLKGDYDQAAQKAEITFEDIMNMLRDCFRCYWYIEDNKLKIEHISFFMNGGGYSNLNKTQLDFTKLKDQFNKKQTSYFQSEFEFDKSNLNSRYEFKWMDDTTDLFSNNTIDVKANYIQKDKTEEINISQFTSDVDFMLFNPNNFSNDGFALLCPIKSKEGKLELPIIYVDELIDENGNTYNATVQNWYASFIYLQDFYMWDMPAKSIESNVLSHLHVRNIKKCMQHTLEFPSEEDLDTLKSIKTLFGNGSIDELTINLNTRMTKAKLVYEPR